jgi:hypothetical protein
LIFTPTIIAFSICPVVNRPSLRAISKTVTPAMIVGTWKAPLAMNSPSEHRGSSHARLNRPRLRAPEFQRGIAATEAMYLMMRHVFDELGYRRYAWQCNSLNARSRAAATRLGFKFEGVWRQANVHKVRIPTMSPADSAMMSPGDTR